MVTIRIMIEEKNIIMQIMILTIIISQFVMKDLIQ